MEGETQSPDLAIPEAMEYIGILGYMNLFLSFCLSYFKLCFCDMQLKVPPASIHVQVEKT